MPNSQSDFEQIDNTTVIRTAIFPSEALKRQPNKRERRSHTWGRLQKTVFSAIFTAIEKAPTFSLCGH